MDKRLKEKIRKFYEKEIAKFPEESITDFKYKFKIGDDAFTPEDIFNDEEKYQKLSPSSLSTALSKREQVPQSFLDACDRISWYLKHNFGIVTVIKLPFQEIITFAICIEGYVDDGWDNSGSFIEIYNQEGELVGASMIPDIEKPDDWRWMNRPIKNFDFNSATLPWSEDEEHEEKLFERAKRKYDIKRAEKRRLKNMMD